jgi:hypothetical protein
MRYILFLLLTTPFIVGCSSDSVWKAGSKTKNFVSNNLVFVREENIYANKKSLAANIHTLDAAKMKRAKPSTDPYYPQPKPWDPIPQAVTEFPETLQTNRNTSSSQIF